MDKFAGITVFLDVIIIEPWKSSFFNFTAWCSVQGWASESLLEKTLFLCNEVFVQEGLPGSLLDFVFSAAQKLTFLCASRAFSVEISGFVLVIVSSVGSSDLVNLLLWNVVYNLFQELIHHHLSGGLPVYVSSFVFNFEHTIEDLFSITSDAIKTVQFEGSYYSKPPTACAS